MRAFQSGSPLFGGFFNENFKLWLSDPANIDVISKAITQFVFRSGPVEDIHARKAITEEEMKQINIYMVNHISALLTCAAKGDWIKLRLLLSYFEYGTNEWNTAEPDMDEIDLVVKHRLKMLCK